jgi:integrase
MQGYFRKRGCKCEEGKKCTCGATWSFTLDIGRDPATGKRKQKTASGFKTKKEAEKACAEIIAQVENGVYREQTKERFGDFLLEYMEVTVKHAVRPSTYYSQMSLVNQHIIPGLGNWKLKELTNLHIQKFYSSKVEEGLSSSYVKNMHNIVSKSLKAAYEWGMIQKNIASLIKAPRPLKCDMQTWTLEQSNQFLEGAKVSKLFIVFAIAIYTGMRKGEILGLRWSDVDLEDAKLTVRQTLTYTDGQFIYNEPKTKESTRVISISDYLVQAFRKHQLKQKEIKLALGEGYQDHGLVVATKYGTPIGPRDVNKDFDRYIERSGLPKIRFHDLRHTHATILLMELGENVNVVSERLGHEGIQITLETYAHVLPNMQKNLAQNFDAAMKKTTSAQ